MSAADPGSPDAGRLIVTSPEGQLLGLLTQADLARAMRLRSSGLPIPTRPASNPADSRPTGMVPPQALPPSWSFPANDPAGFRSPPPMGQSPWYAGR
jgi:hypothetical protein